MNTLGISLEIINFASVKSIKALADRESHEQFSDKMKYDESIKVYRDQLAVMEYERLQGEARGRANVARSMKADGMPVETIARYTGLTPEEIEQL